jgi:hypothetical protein
MEYVNLPETVKPSYLNVEDVIKYDKDLLVSASLVGVEDGEKIKKLNNKVNDLSELVKNEKGEKIILQQNDLSRLVNQESERLDTQRKSIEIAKVSQQRLIALNENSVKRHNEYLKIFALCMLELLFILTLSLVGVPSGLFIILSIVTGSIVVIYALQMHLSIISRDNIYFDELSSEPPKMVSHNNVSSLDASVNSLDASGNSLDASGTAACSGNSCCSTSTMWEPKVQQCVKLKEGYSSIGDESVMIIGKNEKKSVLIDNKNVEAFHNSEYKNYSLIQSKL